MDLALEWTILAFAVSSVERSQGALELSYGFSKQKHSGMHGRDGFMLSFFMSREVSISQMVRFLVIETNRSGLKS